jgi:hypothetical protein
MAGNNNKKIRERVTQMNSAWAQGAPSARFNGISQTDFDTRINAALAEDQGIADDEARLSLRKSHRDGLWQGLNDDSIKVRDGIEGDPGFGRGHPLLDAMGFVSNSQRKSGLTRKKKAAPEQKP